LMSKIAARSTRLLERGTATTIFIYIDQGLASDKCFRSNAWGWQQRRVESISRNMPIISSVLLTLCAHSIFLIAYG
jgi:hypothetical protein